jgi:hypothetical protein
MSAYTASRTNTVDLLERLKTEMPEIWDIAQVVGKWVWLEFNVPPLQEIRTKLKVLGFRWNRAYSGACRTPIPIDVGQCSD